jgi:Ser/Thr protein kinase RdoA (MazF antagonist)
MLENLTFFEDLLKKLIKIKFTTNLLVTHADFGRHNILWEKNKITGILDFENVSYRPKSFDISILLRKLISNKQRKLAVNRYRKFNPLSKKEENQIIILRLIHLCSIFKWIYQDMDKRPDLKEKFFIETITETKRLAKQLESSNSTN